MIFLSTHCPLGNVAVAPMRMWENLTNEKSTLIQIMAWCHEATITWVNTDPDLCCDMATLSHNELFIRMYMKIPFHLSHSFQKFFFSLQLCIVTCPVSDRTALWHIASLYTGQIKAAVWVPEFVWSSLLALCSSPENIFLRKVDNTLASERSLKWTNSWNLIFDFTSNDHNSCLWHIIYLLIQVINRRIYCHYIIVEIRLSIMKIPCVHCDYSLMKIS